MRKTTILPEAVPILVISQKFLKDKDDDRVERSIPPLILLQLQLSVQCL